MRDQLKSHLLCKVTLHLLSPHSSSFFPPLYILRGLDHGMTPRLFLRPFQLLKYCNTARAPLFHQPKAPPTRSRTKRLLPGAGEGVLQKPLPPRSGIRPAWWPLCRTRCTTRALSSCSSHYTLVSGS